MLKNWICVQPCNVKISHVPDLSRRSKKDQRERVTKLERGIRRKEKKSRKTFQDIRVV